MSTDTPKFEWLLEAEAADYCRCSVHSFRRMALPAHNSGGRKVYKRTALDSAIDARPWDRKPASVPSGLPTNLQSVRLRPFKARTPPKTIFAVEHAAATTEELAPLWGYSPDYWLRTIACKPTFPKRLGRRPATWVLSEVLAWRDTNRDPG